MWAKANENVTCHGDCDTKVMPTSVRNVNKTLSILIGQERLHSVIHVSEMVKCNFVHLGFKAHVQNNTKVVSIMLCVYNYLDNMFNGVIMKLFNQ